MDNQKHPFSVFLWIGLGGALGALMRHGTNQLVISSLGESWIYISTSFENVFGSFLMGFLFSLLSNMESKKIWLSHFLLVGMIGSYTTYSGFGVQSITLIQESAPLFLIYFFGQILGGLIFVIFGTKLADRLFK